MSSPSSSVDASPALADSPIILTEARKADIKNFKLDINFPNKGLPVATPKAKRRLGELKWFALATLLVGGAACITGGAASGQAWLVVAGIISMVCGAILGIGILALAARKKMQEQNQAAELLSRSQKNLKLSEGL